MLPMMLRLIFSRAFAIADANIRQLMLPPCYGMLRLIRRYALPLHDISRFTSRC